MWHVIKATPNFSSISTTNIANTNGALVAISCCFAIRFTIDFLRVLGSPHYSLGLLVGHGLCMVHFTCFLVLNYNRFATKSVHFVILNEIFYSRPPSGLQAEAGSVSELAPM